MKNICLAATCSAAAKCYLFWEEFLGYALDNIEKLCTSQRKRVLKRKGLRNLVQWSEGHAHVLWPSVVTTVCRKIVIFGDEHPTVLLMEIEGWVQEVIWTELLFPACFFHWRSLFSFSYLSKEYNNTNCFNKAIECRKLANIRKS